MGGRVGLEAKPTVWAVLCQLGFAEPLGSEEVPRRCPWHGTPSPASAPSFKHSRLDFTCTLNFGPRLRSVNKVLQLKIKV